MRPLLRPWLRGTPDEELTLLRVTDYTFRAQLAEGKKTTFADVQPILATALKVAAGTFLLVNGNLVLICACAYFYNQYSKANAKAEKDRKAAILKAADDGAGAGK